MKLQERLDALKKESMASKPPEIAQIMLQEGKKLVQSGIADKAITVGKMLPEFTLPDERGNLVSSQGLLANGPLVISFYRGVW